MLCRRGSCLVKVAGRRLSDSGAWEVCDVSAKCSVIVTTAEPCARAVSAKPRVNPVRALCARQSQPRVLPALHCAEVGVSTQRCLPDSNQLDVSVTSAKPGVVDAGKGQSCARQFCVVMGVGQVRSEVCQVQVSWMAPTPRT